MQPQYTHELEFIAPELAAEYLKKGGANRILSLGGVRRLTAAMSEGRWDNNAPQLIIFDINGHLRDGQHRLHASARSGVGFWAIVVREMPVESFSVLDTGKRRTAAEVLAMEGVHYAAVSASAAKYAKNYIEGAGLRVSRDNDEIRAFVSRHPMIPTLAQKCWSVRKKFGPSPFTAVMFLASYERTLHKKIDQFVAGVVGGADQSYAAGDPRFMLREWADRELARQKGAVIRPEPLMMATSKAWNAFAEGRNINNARELTSKDMASKATMPIRGFPESLQEAVDQVDRAVRDAA